MADVYIDQARGLLGPGGAMQALGPTTQELYGLDLASSARASASSLHASYPNLVGGLEMEDHDSYIAPVGSATREMWNGRWTLKIEEGNREIRIPRRLIAGDRFSASLLLLEKGATGAARVLVRQTAVGGAEDTGVRQTISLPNEASTVQKPLAFSDIAIAADIEWVTLYIDAGLAVGSWIRVAEPCIAASGLAGFRGYAADPAVNMFPDPAFSGLGDLVASAGHRTFGADGQPRWRLEFPAGTGESPERTRLYGLPAIDDLAPGRVVYASAILKSDAVYGAELNLIFLNAAGVEEDMGKRLVLANRGTVDADVVDQSRVIVPEGTATVQVRLTQRSYGRSASWAEFADIKIGSSPPNRVRYVSPQAAVKEKPLVPNYFPDPLFVGVGLDAADDKGWATVESNETILRMESSGANLVRSYYLPALGQFSPGKTVHIAANMLSFGAATGTEFAVIFRDAAGAEVGRLTAKSDANNTWQDKSASGTVPATTARLQLRFVSWGASTAVTVSKWRNVQVLDRKSAAIFADCFTSPAFLPSSSASIVYVDPAAGSDTNPGTANSRVKTISRAIALLRGVGRVLVSEGDLTETVSLASAVDLQIMRDGNARVRIIKGIKIAGNITKTAGHTKVYQAPLAAPPNGSGVSSGIGPWVWEHETPEAGTLIAAEERHPLQRGRAHRLPSTRLWAVGSLAEIDADPRPTWWWDAGVLYFSASDGGDATARTYYVPGGGNGITAAGSRGRVEITGIESWYGDAPFSLSGMHFRLTECAAFCGRLNGFTRDDAIGEEIRCESAGNGNDGSNAHTTDSPHDAQASAVIVDPWYHDNADDGESSHERCLITVFGGLSEYNGDRGFAPAGGAHYTLIGTHTRHNGQIDLVGGEGVGCVNPAVASEGGIGTQAVCVGCLSESDRYGFGAHASDATLLARDCRVIGATARAYGANAGGRIELIDCRDSGSAAAKGGAGTIVVRNTDLVT